MKWKEVTRHVLQDSTLELTRAIEMGEWYVVDTADPRVYLTNALPFAQAKAVAENIQSRRDEICPNCHKSLK